MPNEVHTEGPDWPNRGRKPASPAGPATDAIYILVPPAVKAWAKAAAAREGKSLARWLVSRIEIDMAKGHSDAN